MERRKFVIGLGSLAAGGAAATGTGAFTSTSANRGFKVQVANDASAYLGLSDVPSAANNQYVSQDGGSGELAINVSSSGNGGSGINLNAHTRIDDLFRIENQGTQDIYVWINLTGNGDKDNAFFYLSEDPAKALSPDSGNGPSAYEDQGDTDSLGPDRSTIQFVAVLLTPGEFVDVGFDIEKTNNKNAFASDGGLEVNAVADSTDIPSDASTYDP